MTPLADSELPIEGYVELDIPVAQIWQSFLQVKKWSRWNKCIFWGRVWGGELKQGAWLIWVFNPIKPYYLYKLPSIAKIVEFEPERKITWEVTVLPGFHARHSYIFEELAGGGSRFGSWEVASGFTYRLLRRFWLAHFRFVRDESLKGIQNLNAN
jgi:hypothetical protein